MAAPAGAPTRLKVSVFGCPLTRSGSATVGVNVRVAPGTAVAVAGTVRVGATFTSRTVSVTGASVALNPSDTRTEKENVFVPWASVGVEVKAPVTGSMAAPAGAPTRANRRLAGSSSGSVAAAVNEYGASS